MDGDRRVDMTWTRGPLTIRLELDIDGADPTPLPPDLINDITDRAARLISTVAARR